MTSYEKLDIIFSAIGVITTFILTIIIITQTSKLNEKQQKLEKQINDSQMELQEKQIKLDLYNHRREVLYFVIEFSDYCIRVQSVGNDEDGPLDFKVQYLKTQGGDCLVLKRKMMMIETDSKNLFSKKTSFILDRFTTDVSLMLGALLFMESDADYSKLEGKSIEYLDDEIKYAGTVAQNILDYKDDLIKMLQEEIKVDL